MRRTKEFLKRWQEYTGWLPGLVLVCIAAWLVFGALDHRLGTDALAFLLELPIRTAYALAAIGITVHVRRRWRNKLSAGMQADLWVRLLNGERAAMVVYLTDALQWTVAVILAFLFFWPAR